MTDTTKPKSAGDLETEAMQVDEERLPQEVTTPTTNAVDNSGFAVWCKNNGLSDQVVQTLQDAGFRTPKDLMDREKDLIGLVFERKLNPDQFNSLKDAIERMRNASASNSVDNAALGLTTMDKQQHTAARDDALADAQRALDDDVHNEFIMHRDSNKLAEQRKELKLSEPNFLIRPLPYLGLIRPPPYFGDCVDLIASDYYIDANLDEGKSSEGKSSEGKSSEDKSSEGKSSEGKSSEDKSSEGKSSEDKSSEGKSSEGKFVSPVQASVARSFPVNGQLAKTTVIVQAFGCGKTRAALEMHKTGIVLPIRLELSHPLIVRLIEKQKQLRTELGSQPSDQQVKQFSERCLRLVELALLALLALLLHCSTKKIIDVKDEAGRFNLAILLLGKTTRKRSSTEMNPLTLWAANWFEQHVQNALREAVDFDELRNKVLIEKKKLSTLMVVFVLDEMHLLEYECSGYVLHKRHEGDEILQWRHEQELPIAERNDLHYQFRRVIVDYLIFSQRGCAFIACSTAFKVWNHIADVSSPLNHDVVSRVFNLHVFSAKDVMKYIQHYFSVPDVMLNSWYGRLSNFNRPRYATWLVEELASALPESGDLTAWFDRAADRAWFRAFGDAKQKVFRFAQRVMPVDKDNTSCSLLEYVYSQVKLHGGVIAPSDKAIVELVDVGIVRLVSLESVTAGNTTGKGAVADSIFLHALERVLIELSTTVTCVLNVLLKCGAAYQSAPDSAKSTKGLAGKLIIACLAVHAKLKVDPYLRMSRGEMPCTSDTDESGKMTLAPEVAAVAGVQDEIQHHFKRVFATESELIWEMLEEPKVLPCVLFPAMQCGPDVLFRSRNGGSKVLAIQVKMESDHYSLGVFADALVSLDPTLFYKASKEADKDAMKLAIEQVKELWTQWSGKERKTKEKTKTKTKVADGNEGTIKVNRQHWLSQLSKLSKFEYHRIVFVALGFSTTVQYLVREYNQAQHDGARQKTPSYIHLLSLDNVREELSGAAYNTLLSCAVQAEKEVQTSGAALSTKQSKQCEKNVLRTILLQRDWMELNDDKKREFKEKDLMQMCDMRGISVAGKHEELIARLNAYKIETVLEALKWDIKYPSAASPSEVAGCSNVGDASMSPEGRSAPEPHRGRGRGSRGSKTSTERRGGVKK